MVDLDEQREVDAQLTDEEKLENVIRLAFGGDRKRFEEFCSILEQHTPANTAAVLGGSSVTGHNYKEGKPFDAEGPMSSDLDITFVGNEVINQFSLEGFWFPGVHTHPVKEGDAIWMAPYCPQWFVAMGKTPASYIYYKDVNREPM